LVDPIAVAASRLEQIDRDVGYAACRRTSQFLGDDRRRHGVVCCQQCARLALHDSADLNIDSRNGVSRERAELCQYAIRDVTIRACRADGGADEATADVGVELRQAGPGTTSVGDVLACAGAALE